MYLIVLLVCLFIFFVVFDYYKKTLPAAGAGVCFGNLSFFVGGARFPSAGTRRYAAVAQLVEQPIRNRQVVGSNPTCSSNYSYRNYGDGIIVKPGGIAPLGPCICWIPSLLILTTSKEATFMPPIPPVSPIYPQPPLRREKRPKPSYPHRPSSQNPATIQKWAAQL